MKTCPVHGSSSLWGYWRRCDGTPQRTGWTTFNSDWTRLDSPFHWTDRYHFHGLSRGTFFDFLLYFQAWRTNNRLLFSAPTCTILWYTLTPWRCRRSPRELSHCFPQHSTWTCPSTSSCITSKRSLFLLRTWRARIRGLRGFSAALISTDSSSDVCSKFFNLPIPRRRRSRY